MLFLARKNLFEQPLRLGFSVLGVGLAVMLILVMWGILQGTVGQAGAYVRNTDAQVWVVQKGFTDIAHGFSIVPADLDRELRKVPGIVSASPITGARTEVPTQDGEESLGVIGYDTATGVGGPWQFATEKATPKRGQLVVDETFADTAGFEVGDELEFSDGSREIVALSAETNQFTNQLAFGTLDDVRGLLGLKRDVNFFAVRVKKGRTDDVSHEIERRFDGISAFSKAEFVANNEREIRDGFQPILYVMVGIAFFVGVAIVGLTMYTATTEKAREYGVLSAIGADRRDLAGVIIRQSAIASALGFVIGCVLVLPAETVISALAPKTELELPWWLFAITAGSAALMALVASYLPVRRIATLDPASVFRA